MMRNLLSPAHLFFWSCSNSTGILLFKITEKGVMPPSYSMDNLVERVSLALMMNKLKKVSTLMTLYLLVNICCNLSASSCKFQHYLIPNFVAASWLLGAHVFGRQGDFW
jgi:hypothetical protein